VTADDLRPDFASRLKSLREASILVGIADYASSTPLNGSI
jgi:hypothetical protein